MKINNIEIEPGMRLFGINMTRTKEFGQKDTFIVFPDRLGKLYAVSYEHQIYDSLESIMNLYNIYEIQDKLGEYDALYNGKPLFKKDINAKQDEDTSIRGHSWEKLLD